MSTLARARSGLKEIFVNRAMQYVRVKRGSMTHPFVLEHRHIFILPTTFGWGFGLLLIVMALGGLNFNNNMALMLVFLVATITQLTTLIAYRNLSELSLDSIHVEPVFCGETAHFRVFVSNGGERQRFAVQAGFDRALDCTDFKLNACESLFLTHPTAKRGWLKMPDFWLETRFPLGLFKAWSWIFPQTRCLVYPVPSLNPPPLPGLGQGQSGAAKKGDGDQFHGLRKYQAGDSIHQIAWRASARHDELFSREMETPREQACELDWNLLQGSDTETRLSILTAWIITADRKHLLYSLKLPDRHVAYGHGADHRATCLELLALFNQ